MIYKSRYVLTINLSEIGMWEEGLRALPEDFQKVHLNGQLGDENASKMHSSINFASLQWAGGTLNDGRAFSVSMIQHRRCRESKISR